MWPRPFLTRDVGRLIMNYANPVDAVAQSIIHSPFTNRTNGAIYTTAYSNIDLKLPLSLAVLLVSKMIHHPSPPHPILSVRI